MMIDFKICNDDALDFLKTLTDESVDLFITDPPYESLEKHRKRGTTTRLKQSAASSNEWLIFSLMRALRNYSAKFIA